MKKIDKSIFAYLTKTNPDAVCTISGGEKYPNIAGQAEFYRLPSGVIVIAEFSGLPITENNIFAMHIHEGDSCEGDFSLTGGHYNPVEAAHPNHAGDLPPLFACKGEAFMLAFTDRFTIPQVIGRTLVLHENVDDFTSQPAGNSGQKIACGVIKAT